MAPMMPANLATVVRGHVKYVQSEQGTYVRVTVCLEARPMDDILDRNWD